jgi:hypothetical protein
MPQPRPRVAQDKPDGAKPGSGTPGRDDHHAFDAESRAKAREAAPVTVGEQVFHRRRKNWKVTRDLRGLLRVQERAGIRSNRANKRIEDAPADEPMDAIEALETEVDGYQDEADEAAYSIIALLLANDEGESPDLDYLKEQLDVEDAGDMAATLSGGGEPPEGPTQTETS